MMNDDSAGSRRVERGRWHARRKAEVVLRLLRGEELELVAREVGIKTSTLAEWREGFLAGGSTALLSRERDDRDLEIQRLRAKLGEVTMANELLRDRCQRLEVGLRPPTRSSRP